MKKTLKTLITLGLASVMLFATAVTSFAAADYAEDGNRLKLYGQVLQQAKSLDDGFNIYYLAIVDGNDTLAKEDFAPVDSTKSFDNIVMYYNFGEKLQEYTADDIRFFINYRQLNIASDDEEESMRNWKRYSEMYNGLSQISYTVKTVIGDDMIDYDVMGIVYICKLPEGKTAADMGEFADYVIYADGAPTSDISNPTTSAQDTGDWASNETGWWIQFNDGSYLTNSWWQSPYSGLWYYMGADGYMVTNTTIDGYTINGDGVWVQ